MGLIVFLLLCFNLLVSFILVRIRMVLELNLLSWLRMSLMVVLGP